MQEKAQHAQMSSWQRVSS